MPMALSKTAVTPLCLWSYSSLALSHLELPQFCANVPYKHAQSVLKFVFQRLYDKLVTDTCDILTFTCTRHQGRFIGGDSRMIVMFHIARATYESS